MTSTHNGAGLDEDESSLAEELEAVALRKGTPPVMFAPEGSTAYQCVDGRWEPLAPMLQPVQAEAPRVPVVILTRTIMPATLAGARRYQASFPEDVGHEVAIDETIDGAIGKLVRIWGAEAGVEVREAKDE